MSGVGVMAAIEPDGTGLRRRVTIAGEHYYFVATKGEDGWIHFMAKTPDENKATGRERRKTADETCKVLGQMVNALLGNKGRPK